MQQLSNKYLLKVPTMGKSKFKSEAVTDLVRVVDSDLEASQDLACGRVLVHGNLELALWAVLSVEGGRVVVEVDHPYRHRRDVVVWQLPAAFHLRRLGF